jgi:hypothetical protein
VAAARAAAWASRSRSRRASGCSRRAACRARLRPRADGAGVPAAAGRARAGEAWITAFDVGQGLAVVVRTATRTLVYDAGPAFGAEADSGGRILVPELRAAGASGVDLMVLTHEDTDHIGGALSVLESVEVQALASSLPQAHALNALVPAPRRCLAGESWDWDGVRFAFLHPRPEEVLCAAITRAACCRSRRAALDAPHRRHRARSRSNPCLRARDQSRRHARPAPRQPHLVQRRVRRSGRAALGDRRRGLSQPLRASERGSAAALRQRAGRAFSGPTGTARSTCC